MRPWKCFAIGGKDADRGRLKRFWEILRDHLGYQDGSTELNLIRDKLITHRKLAGESWRTIAPLKNRLVVSNMRIGGGKWRYISEFSALKLYRYIEERGKDARNINDLGVIFTNMQENQETPDVNMGSSPNQILITIAKNRTAKKI